MIPVVQRVLSGETRHSVAHPAFRRLSHASGSALRSGARVRLHNQGDSSETAKDLLKRGVAHMLSRDEKTAGGLFEEARNLLCKNLDLAVQRDVYACIGNLALYRGEFEAAEDNLEQAWDVAQHVVRGGMGHDAYIDHAGVACDLAAAKVLRRQEYDEADKLLRRSLYHLERAYRPNRSCVVAALLNRAEISSMQKEEDSRAMELLQRALSLSDAEIRGNTIVDFAGTPLFVLLTASLSRTYRAIGDVPRSMKVLGDVVQRDDVAVGTSYRLHSQLSLSLLKDGNQQAAAEAQRRCLSELHSVWCTHRHPDVAIATNNCALFTETAQEASDMYEKAGLISGDRHPECQHNALIAKGELGAEDNAMHLVSTGGGNPSPLREKVGYHGRSYWLLNHANLAFGVSTIQILS